MEQKGRARERSRKRKLHKGKNIYILKKPKQHTHTHTHTQRSKLPRDTQYLSAILNLYGIRTSHRRRKKLDEITMYAAFK